MFGWRYEAPDQNLCCDYCLRRTPLAIYVQGPAVQLLQPQKDTQATEEVKKAEFVFSPEVAHYAYCKWVHCGDTLGEEKRKTGVEVSTEMLRARFDLAKKSVCTARLIRGDYRDPEKYIEEKLRVASQIRMIYQKSELMKGSVDGFVVKRDAKRLRDVDQLGNEKFVQYIERKLKESQERSKQLQEKAQQISDIVVAKRKRVEEMEKQGWDKRAKLAEEPEKAVEIPQAQTEAPKA